MKNILIPIVIVSLVTSCVRSIYPLTDDERQFIARTEFLGNWRDEDQSEYRIDTVNGHDGKLYSVMVIDRSSGNRTDFSDTSYFLAHLVMVRGHLFADFVPDMEKFENNHIGESAAYSVMPLHFFARIYSTSADQIELALMDNDKLSKLLVQKKFVIKHESIDKDNLVLSERGAQLQQKLIDLERFPGVYEKSVLKRDTQK